MVVEERSGGSALKLTRVRTARAGLTVQAPLVAAAPAVARVLRVTLYAARNDLPAQRSLLRCLAHSCCCNEGS